jgi:hypothetical protein
MSPATMTRVMVYPYEYFDRETGTWRRGERYATAPRIAKLGGVLIATSGRMIEASRVAPDGFVPGPGKSPP